jgi:hypothetical protein
MLFDSSDAILSDCKRYRYQLTRQWNPDLATIVFVMLNPSTADASANDPTIRRCINFAHGWGFGGLKVLNLFAWRATNPAELKTVVDPIGIDNDRHLLEAFGQATTTVVAWGVNAPATRVLEVSNLLREAAIIPQCLGATRAGHPRHPLYVPRTHQMQPYILPDDSTK